MARIKRLKTAATTADSTASKPKSTYSETVDPFQPMPQEFKNLCSVLDKDRIHVFHVDQTAVDLKRRVFMVPVWMNVLFTLGLLARLYYAIPFYCSFIISYFGRQGDPWIQADKLPWLDFMSLVVSRLAIVAFDMFLSTKVISWPVAFCFAAPASPVNWRMAVGFQGKEIITRKSRSFHSDLKAPWSTDDLLTVKIFAREALDKQALQKTAYTMIADKRWDLDYVSMIKAHEVVANSEELSLSELDRIVLAYTPKAAQWQVWRLNGTTQRSPGRENDNAAKLRRYLRAKRKEDLFYRYIELIQYETSLANSGTSRQRQSMMQQIKDEFAKAQLDFESVVAEFGGLQNMPGFEEDPLS